MCVISFSKKNNYKSKEKLETIIVNPKWAYIEITKQCNHKCPWCYGKFNNTKTDFISVEDYKTVINKCKEIGISQISLSGGEPTLHPNFKEIVKLSKDFDLHLITHGNWSENIIDFAKENFSQIQFNYQGYKNHDNIHGILGSYQNQKENMIKLVELGCNVVGTVTVGDYNIQDIPEIFCEMRDIGVERIRIWETTGVGCSFVKKYSVEEIFKICDDYAKQIGYTYCQSYDPLYKGDIGLPCLPLSKIFMYIDSHGNLLFCGSDNNTYDKPIASFINDDVREILNKYYKFIDSITRDVPHCNCRI